MSTRPMLPHNMLGKEIYDLCVQQGMIHGYSNDVIIHAMLSSLQSWAANSDNEVYAINVMGDTARQLSMIRDAKIEAITAVRH